MLYFLWIPLLCFRSILVLFINSTVLALLVTLLLITDYCLIILKKGTIKRNDLLLFFLACLCVPFRNLVIVFDLVLIIKLLAYIDINRVLYLKLASEIAAINLLFYLLASSKLTDVLSFYDKKNTALHSLGFSNSNVASNFFFNFLITLFLLSGKLKSSFLMLTAIISDYAVYSLCYGRTYHYGFLIMVLLYILNKNNFFKNKIFKYFKLTTLFLTILTILLPIIAFTMPSFSFLKSMLTGRLYYYFAILNQVDFKTLLFGMKYKEDAPLDSSYIMTFLSGGVFFLAYLIKSFMYQFKIQKKNYSNADLPFLCGVAVAGFTESFFSGVGMTSGLFWFLLSQRKENNKLRRLECTF